MEFALSRFDGVDELVEGLEHGQPGLPGGGGPVAGSRKKIIVH